MKLKKCNECEHRYEVYGCEKHCALEDKGKDCPYELGNPTPVCPMCGKRVDRREQHGEEYSKGYYCYQCKTWRLCYRYDRKLL